MGAIAGLFGVTVGALAKVVHLSGVKCLGVAYLSPFSQAKDASILRRRLVFSKYRSRNLNPQDRRNQR